MPGISAFIDVLRTSYVSLPRSAKVVLAPLLSVVPVQARFGAHYKALSADVLRSRVDAEFVRDQQLHRVRELVSAAWTRSPFYRQRLAHAFGQGFDPARMDPSTLAGMPPLTKSELAEQAERMLVVPAGRMTLRNTSGSAHSTRLRVFLDPDRSVREMAFVHSFAADIGWRLGDRRVRLDGNLFDKGQVAARESVTDNALRELWLSPFRLSEATARAHLARIRDYDPVLLYGVPSALAVLARCAERDGWTPGGRFRGILTTSETLFPHQRELFSRAFGGAAVRSYYGLTERCAIAAEVIGAPDVLEFEPLYGLTELVDGDGQPVTTPGQYGRIVSTGFISTGMPLIRYDTGDRAALVEAPSEGNCYRLRVAQLRSRWSQEYLVGRNQELISVVNYLQDVDDGILHDYQFVQDAAGYVTLLAVLTPDARPGQLDDLVAFHNRLTAGALVLDAKVVQEIPRGMTAKAKLVDQKLQLPRLAGTSSVRAEDDVRLETEPNPAS